VPDPNIIRINHTIFSWTSCAFQINGEPWKGIVEVNWEQKRERKVVYAANQDGTPLGKTSGKYSVTGFTLKMLRDSAEALKLELSALGLGSYGDAEFVFSGQMIEPVVGSVPITFIGETCTIDGEKEGHAEGVDELVTEFEIGCLAFTSNGLRLWSVTREIGL